MRLDVVAERESESAEFREEVGCQAKEKRDESQQEGTHESSTPSVVWHLSFTLFQVALARHVLTWSQMFHFPLVLMKPKPCLPRFVYTIAHLSPRKTTSEIKSQSETLLLNPVPMLSVSEDFIGQ